MIIGNTLNNVKSDVEKIFTQNKNDFGHLLDDNKLGLNFLKVIGLTNTLTGDFYLTCLESSGEVYVVISLKLVAMKMKALYGKKHSMKTLFDLCRSLKAMKTIPVILKKKINETVAQRIVNGDSLSIAVFTIVDFLEMWNHFYQNDKYEKYLKKRA